MRAARRLCGLLALGLALQGGPARAEGPRGGAGGDLRAALAAPGAREAIARVAWAEAASQGDGGLLAVVCTILNRLADGRWGASVDQVVNARAQFEPVLRAGGDWRSLPAASAVQRARIDTLVNLALEGWAPDPTGGALWFQNPRIVAARARAGQVSASLVHFGGRSPEVVIGDHAFYAEAAARPALSAAATAIFASKGSPAADGAPSSAPAAAGRGIFVLPDGSRVESQR